MDIILDLRFKRFLTTKIVSVLYVLWIIVCVLFAAMSLLVGVFGAVNQGPVQLFGALLAALFGAPVLLVIGRIYLEVIVVLFRIAENIQAYAEREGLTTVFRPIKGRDLLGLCLSVALAVGVAVVGTECLLRCLRLPFGICQGLGVDQRELLTSLPAGTWRGISGFFIDTNSRWLRTRPVTSPPCSLSSWS